MVKTSCESDNPKQTFSCTGLTFMEKRQISYLWAQNRQHFEIWIKILTIRLWTLNRRSAWRLVLFFHAKNLMHTILSQIQIQKKMPCNSFDYDHCKKKCLKTCNKRVWETTYVDQWASSALHQSYRQLSMFWSIHICSCFNDHSALERTYWIVSIHTITKFDSVDPVSLFSRSIQWDKR